MRSIFFVGGSHCGVLVARGACPPQVTSCAAVVVRAQPALAKAGRRVPHVVRVPTEEELQLVESMVRVVVQAGEGVGPIF